MIVKFNARGSGGGAAPIDYLLGKDHNREGAELISGSIDDVKDLIDSSKYAKKYTSGVLSFKEVGLPAEVKEKLMRSFEGALLPSFDKSQYSILWVEHRDKGRLELNFLIPNIELQTGKRLQPYYHKADCKRIDAWKTIANEEFKLHDPNDPANQRTLVTANNLPKSREEIAQAITTGLMHQIGSGAISDRDGVVQALKGAGFSIAWQAGKSISIADPDGGKNIRLKGAIYEQNFRFSKEFRAEIEAASAEYREGAKERVREAQSVYRTGIEIKQRELERRYSKPEQAIEKISAKDMAVAATDSLARYHSELGVHQTSRHDDREIPIEDHGAESPHKKYQNNLRQLESQGAKIQIGACGEQGRFCIKINLNENRYGEDGVYPWMIPEGY